MTGVYRCSLLCNCRNLAIAICRRNLKSTTQPLMTLDSACRELDEIAQLLIEEHRLVRLMRAHGEAPSAVDESRAYAGGISQMALMLQPLLIAALDLELASALVA